MTSIVRRFLLGVCLALALVAFGQFGVAKASSLTDSRIRQLESQVRSLQTQVSQLQSQRPNAGSSTAIPPQPTGTPFTELTPQQQFDNLATLVIEINQRVIALESKEP